MVIEKERHGCHVRFRVRSFRWRTDTSCTGGIRSVAVDLNQEEERCEREMQAMDRTFGILITRCPVVFDRSASDSDVFTSSGKTNWRT